MNIFQFLAILLVLSAIAFTERVVAKTVLVALAGVAFILSLFAGKLL